MKTIVTQATLVPVDFSEQSFAAVDVACDIAGDASHVMVVYVLPDVQQDEHDLLLKAIDHSKRQMHAETVLRARFDDRMYEGLEVKVTFGDPGSRIAELAKIKHVGLIVMSSHGRTGAKRLLLGSVTERVLRQAHCAVLVLRDRHSTDSAKKAVA